MMRFLSKKKLWIYLEMVEFLLPLLSQSKTSSLYEVK